mmetsp:Transcript_118871/g.236848  ORF Transcript_118871/g.236848 Transcript_118871/m.236848 type:complete len:406 (+) Transcript_118871:41-1258(+)
MSVQQAGLVVVGAGLTGSVLCHLLKKAAPQLSVQVWDKARGAGGRYNTWRPSAGSSMLTNHEMADVTGSGVQEPIERPLAQRPSLHADLGAQYITAFEPECHGHYYEAMVDVGVLKEISHDRIHGGRGNHAQQQHWSVPAGMSSIPKFFLGCAHVEFGRRLRSISVSSDGGAWLLQDENGKEQLAQAVVLTCPVPQVLELTGNIREALEPHKEELERVSYSSRYALGLHYSVEAWERLQSVPWNGKYFTPDVSDVIVWVSISGLDALRTAQELGPSVVVHTTVPYGLKNAETSRETVQATILEHLHRLLPELKGLQPVESKLIFWKWSQVYKGFQHDEEVRPAALQVCDRPLLLLAGDAFTKSGFDGCVDAAEAACAAIIGARPEVPTLTASSAGVAEQIAKAQL